MNNRPLKVAALILGGLLALAAACSPWEAVRVARIAATGDLLGAQRLATEKAIRYATNPKALERDIKRFQAVLKKFHEAVTGTWGEGEAREPRPKEYVKYTQNYMSRALVDFDHGVITVETLDQKDPLASLKTAIVTTLLTPNDPRAVDLFSSKEIKLGETPFLLGEVKDHEGQEIRWSWRAERYAAYLAENRLQVREISSGAQTQTVRFVVFDMVKDHLMVRADKYRHIVDKMADRFGVSRNLIFAVMKTESDFNPYAVSSAPAFGLMQIVPTTAGADVFEFLNHQAGIPSQEFLFIPENNIEYGTAYLHLIENKYLSGIENEISLEYCTIAAYNTGSGNVYRTFDSSQSRAIGKINSLEPLAVYETLRSELPYQETRDYLVKVLDAKKQFVNF